MKRLQRFSVTSKQQPKPRKLSRVLVKCRLWGEALLVLWFNCFLDIQADLGGNPILTTYLCDFGQVI